MIGVTVLGSTGSIGVSTLDVLARHAGRYRVVALTANTDAAHMAKQCLSWQPDYAVMVDADAADDLEGRLRAQDCETAVLSGREALETVATSTDVDVVMAAIVGAAGLLPTLAAVRAGKRVLLANKEALVMTGRLFMDELHAGTAELLPIDSEHNAVFQCLPTNFREGLGHVGVKRILLTASGGPFRQRAPTELIDVTPEEACSHPNWDMGRKISVDSATMMNKGLEVIEACWLFDTIPDRVDVVVHPQSMIHSMVEYIDGSILAQMAQPDMRVPIAHAFAWPDRLESGVEGIDVFALPPLNFEPPDYDRFPCLQLAFEAMRRGGTAPAVLNAANEVAVAAFLAGSIAFTDIPVVIERTMDGATINAADSLDVVLASDEQARHLATGQVEALGRRAVL